MHSKHGHGEGASPALFGDTLVVPWDHEEGSFVVALDAETGEERWRTERDEVTSWSTPIVALVDGKPQAILNGTTAIRGYDLATGAVLWACSGLSQNVVASPIVADGVVYAASSYEKQAMIAIDVAGAKGPIALDDERVLWYRRKQTPYVPSPVLVEDSLYVLHHYEAKLSQVDRETGEDVHRALRIQGLGSVYASLVAAAGRVYVTDLEGSTAVLETGPEPKVLAVNRLDDGFSASAVLAGKELFLRGERFLYCIAEE
jgi:outer membrane protein assembly factor BamB